ncbi:hypothetical protein JOJ88_003441 [Pantoea cypripedii]|nr:hypothetical protein [Pantoea cypripedii]
MNSRKQFIGVLVVIFIGSLLLLETLARLVHLLVVG